AEVDVQRLAARVVVQQVLAVRLGVHQDAAVEALRTGREPALRAAHRDRPPGEQLAVPLGEAVDGVTFRHPNVYTRRVRGAARYPRFHESQRTVHDDAGTSPAALTHVQLCSGALRSGAFLLPEVARSRGTQPLKELVMQDHRKLGRELELFHSDPLVG